MNAPSEMLTYADLESEMHDAVNMSELACQVVEGAGTRLDRGILVTEAEWNMLNFAVVHVNSLALTLKGRWNEIHESNVASKGGGR